MNAQLWTCFLLDKLDQLIVVCNIVLVEHACQEYMGSVAVRRSLSAKYFLQTHEHILSSFSFGNVSFIKVSGDLIDIGIGLLDGFL